MRNTYFQFKKFRIDQDFDGLGVTTDACILGAWAGTNDASSLLDIGTGTGLLTLMQLQKNEHLQVDAIEISQEAAAQAGKNFRNSPWSNKIKLFHSSLEDFMQSNEQEYDVIISNPPFFKNHTKSQNKTKDYALHDDELPMESLLSGIAKHLKKTGRAYVMYPYHESLAFERMLLQKGISIMAELLIYNKANTPVFRRIMVIGKERSPCVSDELMIRIAGSYSQEFIRLLKPFYLHL